MSGSADEPKESKVSAGADKQEDAPTARDQDETGSTTPIRSPANGEPKEPPNDQKHDALASTNTLSPDPEKQEEYLLDSEKHDDCTPTTTSTPNPDKQELPSTDDEQRDGKALMTTNASPVPEKQGVSSVEDEKRDASEEQDAQDVPEDNAAHHVHGIARLILVFGLCSTTFIIGLDQMIIATAIPKITTLFKSLDDVGWYGSAYLLCITALQPSFGKVYTYFDVKWTFVVALVIFEAGSIICAAATSSSMLIVGRAIAGSGGAGLYSGGMTMLAYAIPLNQRAIYLACLSSMFGIASIVGPILGGVFTDQLTWRWCFWINLPFGGLTIVTVAGFFKSPHRDFSHISFKQKIKEMDLVGATFLIGAIVCLLLALQWGGIKYPWKNSEVWGCLLGFCLLIGIFITIQVKRGVHATIPVHIMKQRTIIACALVLALLSMGVYSHVYCEYSRSMHGPLSSAPALMGNYLPFYFQAVKGTTAEQSGIRCIAYLISNTIGSIIIGGLVTILGYYTPFIYLGCILFTIGSGLIYTLKVHSPAGRWIGYQILAGFGAGGAIQLPFIATQVVLPAKDMPTGNSLAIFFNSLGGAVAISIAQNIFSNTLVKELPKAGLGDYTGLIVAAGAQGFRAVVPPNLLEQALDAYNKAITTAFVLPVAVGCLAFFGSLLFEWKSVKGKNLMAGGPA